MLTMQLAIMALAVSATGDVASIGSNSPVNSQQTVLLDFQADWCGPCRGMDNTIAQLAAAGYPVQKINIDEQRDLARQFHVRDIPCFVLVRNGQEVDRIVGPTSLAALQGLFAKSRQGQAAVRETQVRAQSPDGPASQFSSNQFSASQFAGSSNAGPGPSWPARNDAAASGGFSDPGQNGRPLNPSFATAGQAAGNAASATAAPTPAQFLAASVRLTVEDAKGFSYGSGTLVDARQGVALILTCGHIFRDSQGKGKITVDVYGPNPQRKLLGELVSYDLKQDIGLVKISPPLPVTAIPIAPPDYRVHAGDNVTSVGCDHGADPTVVASRVNSLNKFFGPANLQVAGLPVEGRSGGGLFSADGFVIGVCNAADPADREGLFAAAATIYAHMDKAGLASVYQRKADQTTALAGNKASQGAASSALAGPSNPQMPARTPNATAALANAGESLRQLSPQERATLATLQQKAQGAEVICIVRSLTDPQAKSEIIVLDRASPAFLNQLSSERHTQDGRHLTSMDVARTAPTKQVPVVRPSGVNGSASGNPQSWQPNWRPNP